jgi:hypothetical protein
MTPCPAPATLPASALAEVLAVTPATNQGFRAANEEGVDYLIPAAIIIHI